MRFKRIVLNLVTSLFRSVFGLLLGLITTPLILGYLGEEKYGAFVVLVDWFSQLGILEFGLYAALLPLFAQSFTPQAKISRNHIIFQATRKYSQVLLFQLVGVLGLYIFRDTLIPTSQELESDLSIAILIMAISIIFCFSQIYRALLDSSQRGYRVSVIMILQNLIIISLALIAAYYGYGIKGQAAAHVFGIGISFILLKILSKNLTTNEGTTSFRKRYFDLNLKKQRSSQILFQICGRLSLLIDNLIISIFLGAKSVTAFYLTQKLILIAMQQLQHFGNASWPALSDLYLRGEKEKFKENIIYITEAIALASGCVLSTLVIVNPSFVQLWTGEATFLGVTFSNIIICNAGLIAINSFWLWCFTGVGEIRLALPMLLTQTVVNLSISFIGTYYFGYLGPITGTFISFFFVSQPWTSWLMHKKFSVSLLSITKAWMIPLVVPLGLAIAYSQTYGSPLMTSWTSLILWSCAIGLSTILLFPFLFVHKESRQRLLGYLSKIIKRKS